MSGRIAIVGCGFIGRAWAIVFARAGYEARLHDSAPGAPAAALAAIEASLADLERAGLIADAGAVRARMTPCASLAEALDGACFAQESVFERRELKAEIFAAMDALAAPEAVLASSASAIPPSAFTAALAGRARCLVGHPANPPHLLPVVELVPAPWTAAETMERAHRLYAAAGQVPVRLKKEIPGFAMNRLQAGVVCEAMHLVAEGVIAPEDLDKVMRYSLGLRWSFMGPFETMDLNAPGGFRDYAERYRMSYEALGEALGVARPWTRAATDAVLEHRRSRLPAETLPGRRGWRDRRLMALLKHVRESDRNFGE